MIQKCTQLILGLVVLPMTLLTQLSGASNGNTDPLLSWSSEKSNPISSSASASDHAFMDLTLTLANADIDPGEQICLPVTVTNFTEIVGMEVTFVFDPSVVSFVDVQNFNLKDLSGSSFGRPGEGTNPQGQLKLSWLDFSAAGVDVADGTTIFEICLEGVANGTDNITLSAGAEAYKPDDSIVLPVLSANTIVVGDGVSDGGGGNTQGLTYSISSANLINGQETCLSFSVEDFTEIIGTEINITYDPNVLQYKSVQGLNLKDLSESSFGEPGVGSNPLGTIKLSWLDFSAAGVTLPDGTVIFEICFEAIAENGTSIITLGPNPEAYDPDDNILTPQINPGTVVVGDGSNSGGGGTGDLTLNLGSATVAEGQETCVAFSVNNFEEVTGMEVTINYDPAVLQFVRVQSLNLKDLSESSFGLPGQGANPAGSIKLSWLDFAASGVTLPDGTVIFEMCFEGIAAGTSNLTLAPNAEAYDPDDNILVPAVDPGTITVTGGSGGGGNPGDVTFSISSASANQGQSFCLDFSVDNFTDVVGMELTINYDPSRLDFTGVQNFNLRDLSEASFGLPGMGTNQPGSIKLSWLDLSAVGVTQPDGTVLFQICFEPTVSGGTTTVQIQSGEEAYDIDDNIIPTSTQPGTVTIGDGMMTFTEFALIIEDASAQAGDTICLPVSVANFTDILGMEFSVGYDPGMLEFVRVQGLNLKDLSESSFGLPGMGNNQPGAIKLSWLDLAAGGVTLADNTVLFEICFVPVSAGTSTVAIDQNQTLEVTDVDENILPVQTEAGQVTVSGEVTPTQFTLDIGRVNTQPGEAVDVPVRVFQFADVLGMEFVINYNPAELQFDNVANFNLKDLTESSFGRPGEGANQPGSLKISWLDLAAAGVTVADGTQLFTIRFTPLIQDGVSNLSLDNSQPIEFIDINEDPIDFDLRPGSVTVREMVPLAFDGNPVVTNVVCRGDSTGAIDVAVTGGSGNYTFEWSYQNATSEDLMNLPAGVYFLTVRDTETGESISDQFTVTEPANGLALTADITDATCQGTTDGAISVNVTGGSAPLNLVWQGDLPDGTTNQSNLDPGNYALTVVDADGCRIDTTLEVGQTDGINIDNIDTNPIGGNGNGEIALTISGGTGNYSYSWTGPNGFSSSMATISNLNVTGEYCVTITDGNTCSASACIMLTERLRISSTDVVQTCPGEDNGSITVNIDGGLPPYQYAWNNGQSGPSISDLGTGDYTVTVTDDIGNSLSGTFEITNLTPIALNPNVTPVTGDENNTNGSIDLSLSGGAPEYTIRWSTGASSEDLSNLATGEYCVTVTDQNGCSVEDCFMIMFTEEMLNFSEEATDILCPGDQTGEIRIMISGGVAPYAVRFDDDVNLSTNNGLITRTDLMAGTYGFVVTDAANTTLMGNVTVNEPDPIQADSIALVHDTEMGGCNGRIELFLSGGTPGYSVRWNAPSTGPEIIGLCAGEYIPTIIDDNNCTVQLEPIEVTTFNLSANSANATCPDDTDGALNLQVNGGSQPFTYEWRNQAGEVISTDQDLIGVAAGTYTVVVSEGSGNTLERNFQVGTSSQLTASLSVLSSYNGFGVSCPGASDGRVRVDAENGAGGSYLYEWILNDNLVGSESVLENAAAGTYLVAVTDEEGCSVTQELDLSAPAPIDVDALVTDVSCPGENDGEILVNVDGGTGQNLNFNWSNGESGSRIRFLRPGEYTLSVTDGNNCTTTSTYMITQPEPISVIVETVPATDGCNGLARAQVSGGVPPYFFEWNSNAAVQDSVLENLCPGNYVVRVTDARGCTNDQGMIRALVSDRRFDCMEFREIMTPDGDGLNERLIINCIEEFPDNALRVFNRYGQLVFETENYDNSWNGTTANGELLPDGPYYFILEYIDFEGQEQQMKGSVSLLREE